MVIKTKTRSRYRKGTTLTLISFATALILIDQLSKFLVFHNKINECFLFFCIKTAVNHGIAFGLFNMSPIMTIITAIISITVIGISSWYIIKNRENKALGLALILIISGTMGNLIDRLFFRYVRDFIAIGMFPAFNIADTLNIIGVVILIIALLKKTKKTIKTFK